ncbi:MAG: RidA family protein [Pseudomonadota bacterium]
MIIRHTPETLRPVPLQFSGIYTHGTEIRGSERIVFLSGQIGTRLDDSTPEPFEEQVHAAMDNVEALLEATGLTHNDILRVVYYVTDPSNLQSLSQIRQQRWNSAQAPAVTTLVVSALASPELKVEIEVTAGQ